MLADNPDSISPQNPQSATRFRPQQRSTTGTRSIQLTPLDSARFRTR